MTVTVEQLLTPEIARPARYLGNERGAVHKDWTPTNVRWVLTYPEIYEVGASNLGHIILYSILNAQPRQLCDRAYLPGPDLAAKLQQTQTPLFAVESRRPLTDFDILGFSLSYELGATNILEMLSLAGIPLTWRERDGISGGAQSGDYPLIFAGGQTATSNPEPYADFFDFIALGDGEDLLPEIGLVIEEGKAAGLSRSDLLLDLAQVPGVYVPRFYRQEASGAVVPMRSDVPQRVLRRVADPMPAYSVGLVPFVETVHDRLTVEVRRGCTRGCRFCQPGMLTRPARDVEPEAVIETIERGIRETGFNELSLLSLSCSDYLALPAVGLEIRNRLKHENISISLPSQRVDRFDEDIANVVGGTRKSSLTFAPEAGTQRMRDIINKGLTNEELLRGVKTAYEQGWGRVKLYFMIGLPGETDPDVLGIAETLRWLQRSCQQQNRKLIGFTVTISNFTPKPHTPFQWHSVSTAEFKRKQALLRDAFRGIRNLKANFTDVRISAMEDFVGRGDRRLASVVKRAWELGAGMDAWWESLDRAFNAWVQAIDESGLGWKYRQVDRGEWALFADAPEADINAVEPAGSDAVVPDAAAPDTATTEDNSDPNTRLNALLDAPLPWDHIDTGIDKSWLQQDLRRALEAATVPDCAFEGCSHCGICGPDFGHNVVVPPPLIPALEAPNIPKTRQQRLRVHFGKLGEVALISHLDLIRLFDRALRRAALPVAFTGGYHPGPRIAPASALPLGLTSSGEIMDVELHESMDPSAFQQQFAAQLPADLPLYRVEQVDVSAPSATKQLDQATYYITVACSGEVCSGEACSSEVETSPIPAPALTPQSDRSSLLPWDGWIQLVLAADDISIEKTTKSGKTKTVNLREWLYDLAIVPEDAAPSRPRFAPPANEGSITLRYVGSCRNDGTMLQPAQVVTMLERVSQRQMGLLHAHRDRLTLTTS
ncbi:MAG: TIGR03960 family B12-binding radical SAM protein [Elainellaceae cyanobacterium]